MTVTLWEQQFSTPDGIQSPRRAVRVLQGLAAEIPVLAEGEFYYAKDTKAVSIGALPTSLAPLASPAFTGTPTAPTQTALTNNTDIATTAYTDAGVLVEKNRATTAESLLAPISSPTFTGVLKAPTLVESATLSPTSAGTAGTTGQIAWNTTSGTAGNIFVCTTGGAAGSAIWMAAALTKV